MKLLRRFLILSHRCLGIVFSFLVMIWFASGIVMMYAGGMPSVTPELRLERMPSLDLQRVRLSPADALRASAAGRPRGETRLLTVMNRPAYRIGGETVFADTGERLSPLDAATARRVAAQFLRLDEDRVLFERTLTSVDQWTLGQASGLPLHQYRVNDPARTEIYVQARTGEVATMTTRRTRALAWIGTIPHWLYFAALRTNQPLWSNVVVWTSAFACIVTILGLGLGIIQYRRTRPFTLAKAIPYAGWIRWHYITGVIFGVFTLTWAFSGLLSMEPFAWTNATGLEAPGDVFTGGPTDLDAFPVRARSMWDNILGGRAIKEMSFTRIQDVHYYDVQLGPAEGDESGPRERLHQPYIVSREASSERVLVAADTLEVRRTAFGTSELLARLRAALPDTPIVESVTLTEYDSYYYSRAGQSPLPVLRVKFGDPARTWFYIDPARSRIVADVSRLNRLERWLYNGLHSLDFSFWYSRRPLWDIGMIALLLGGLASSSIGFCFGVRRLWRGIRRALPEGLSGRAA